MCKVRLGGSPVSFFKEFKEDITQAVNELIPDGQAEDTSEATEKEIDELVNTLDEEPTKEELDALLFSENNDLSNELNEEIKLDEPVEENEEDALLKELLSGDMVAEEPTKELEEAQEVVEESEEINMTEEVATDMDAIDEEAIASITELAKEETNLQKEEKTIDETNITTITEGTELEGNIKSDSNINVNGLVVGDVTCAGKLVISGSITGTINAGEIYANAASVEGNMTSEGSVKVGVGSMVVGNIVAKSAAIAGAVNGDIDVQGPVIVDSTAVIMGNIKSRSVQINNGAVIEGFCSQSYSDVDVNEIFKKNVDK